MQENEIEEKTNLSTDKAIETHFDGRPKTHEGVAGTDKLLEALWKHHPERAPKS